MILKLIKSWVEGIVDCRIQSTIHDRPDKLDLSPFSLFDELDELSLDDELDELSLDDELDELFLDDGLFSDDDILNIDDELDMLFMDDLEPVTNWLNDIKLRDLKCK